MNNLAAESRTSSADILRRFPGELAQRSRVLYWIGFGHLVLAGLLALAMPFDDGVLLGIDRLLKPFKFAVSIWIYAWTFGWLVGHLSSGRLSSVLSWIVAIMMVVEIVPITMQPLLGAASHFNTQDAFGGLLYGLMGAAIAVNTVCAVALLVGLVVASKPLPGTYRLGVILGLLLFLGGSAVGGALVANGGHTVGAPDGGPGLPLVNWSTEAGDLRIAHAAGLHALQIVPLLGFLLAGNRRLSATTARGLLVLFSAGYGAATLALYLQAAGGRPLLG